MDRNQPWFILIILAFIGIIIVIASYYINLYSNPDKYIKRYLIVKAATKEQVGIENSKFIFFDKAKITIETDNKEIPTINCDKTNRLLECNDGFNHFYTVNSQDLLMKNHIFHKNIYDLNWNASNQYEMYGLYPNMLIFDQVIDYIINNANQGRVSEQDLFNGMYNIYGTGDRIGKNNNYYAIEITKSNNYNKLIIKPESNNSDSLYPHQVEVNYQINSNKIKLNRNMFK